MTQLLLTIALSLLLSSCLDQDNLYTPEGRIDVVFKNGEVYGYAFDPDNREHKVTVRFFEERGPGTTPLEIGETIADKNYHEKDIGSHGFWYNLPREFADKKITAIALDFTADAPYGILEDRDNQTQLAQNRSSTNCRIVHDLPLHTHYSNDQGGFLFGATDQAPAPPTNFRPQLNNYWGMTFDTHKISNNRVEELTQSICEETATPIKIYRASENKPRKVDEYSNVVQVIQGNVIENSLATIILPPSWHGSNVKWPILFNGFYSANYNFSQVHGEDMLKIVSQTDFGPNQGVIGVIWNSGGDTGRSFNPYTWVQFNAVIQYVKNHYNGDQNSIFAFGGSRGAITALSMASNPLGFDYNVKLAYAAATPTKIGEHLSLLSPVYPYLYSVIPIDLNRPESWHPDWRDSQTGKTGVELYMSTMVGVETFEEADESSIISDWVMNSLVNQRTQVILDLHTHDNIVPYSLQLEYFLKLSKITPVEGNIISYSGHNGRSKEMMRRMQQAITYYLTKQIDQWINPGTHNFFVDQDSGQIISMPQKTLPTTLEVPRVAFYGEAFPLVITGEPGTYFKLQLLDETKELKVEYEDNISQNGHTTLWQAPLDVDQLFYQLQISNDQYQGNLDMRKTPGGSQYALQTTMQELPPVETHYLDVIKSIADEIPYLEESYVDGPLFTNWGLVFPHP